MGFKLPKIKMPKITVGSPTKLVTNLIQGTTNAATDVTGTLIGANSLVANQALNSVGGVLSNPAAAPVAGIVGASYGIPGLGSLVGAYGGAPEGGASGNLSSSDSLYSSPGGFFSMPTAVSDNKTLIFAGVGGLGLILVIFMAMNSSRRH